MTIDEYMYDIAVQKGRRLSGHVCTLLLKAWPAQLL